MSKKLLIGLLMLIIGSSACTLASQSEGDEADNDEIVLIVTATPSVIETEDPIPDVVQTEEPTVDDDVTNDPQNNTVTCVPRTDWTTYTVARGDTLSGIAVRASTTVDTLVTANCLANPNLLDVGTQLRVPRLPVIVPTQTAPVIPTDTPLISGAGAYNCSEPTYQPVNYVGVVGSGINYRWGCYDVRVGQTITLSWANAPQNVTQVDFMLRFWETMTPMVIASDTNGADGWSAQVVVDASWGQAALFAWTQFGSGIIESDRTGFRVLGPNGGCAPELGEMTIDSTISITPLAETLSQGCFGISASAGQVVVTWQPYDQSFTYVTFYRRNALMSRSDVFGVDDNPSDGFSAVLTVYPEMEPSVIYISAHTSQQGSEIMTGAIGIYIVP